MSAARAEQRGQQWAAALVLLVGCATLAFGAVYPIVYWPVLGACLAVGVLGLTQMRVGAEHHRTAKRLSCAFIGISLPLAAQLLPLPSTFLRGLSPATDAYLARTDVTYGATGDPLTAPGVRGRSHAVSVNPRRTLLGGAFFVTLGVYLLGSLGALQRSGGAMPLANGLAALGVLVALIGMLHPPPYGAPAGFAPFMNRNHFAGWMSMAVSLALGIFAARFSAMRGQALDRRSQFLYLGSPDGAKLILAAFASFLMFASIVASTSRSGMLACTVGVLLMTRFAVRREPSTHRSRTLGPAFLLILVAAALWRGTDPLLARVDGSLRGDLATRMAAWNDAWRVARDFPVAGTGLNTYADVMLLYQTADSATHYSAAHNEYLQIAAEGGILLIVPVAIALTVFVREVRARLAADHPDSRTYWLRRGAVAGIAGVGCQAVFDFSLQIPANALLFSTMCAIALHQHGSRSSHAVRWRPRVVAVGAVEQSGLSKP